MGFLVVEPAKDRFVACALMEGPVLQASGVQSVVMGAKCDVVCEESSAAGGRVSCSQGSCTGIPGPTPLHTAADLRSAVRSAAGGVYTTYTGEDFHC